MRALPALIVIALVLAGVLAIAELPGRVVVVWQGWRVDTSVAVLTLGVTILAVAAAALFHGARKIIGGPAAFLRARRERRRREGYRALTQGMVAVAAGDAEEAQKHARKADVLLAEPPLTLLLSAQAAQLNGDEHAAKRYFTAMLERAETEFLGLRGLLMQALRGGDEHTALQLVERAKALRPRTPWVLSSLFELQARAGKWHEAEATLVEAVKRKAIALEHRLHRAALLHEKSRAAEAQGAPGEALQHAAKAHSLDPGFTTAALRYAHLLRVGGRVRQAAKTLEAAWRAAPHPHLAEAYRALFGDEAPLLRFKRIERLAAAHPEHRESHLAMAAAALEARLWGEARRHLEAAGAKADENGAAPSPRLCRMMAELEEQQHQDHAAARAWLARAASATTPDHTYVCGVCGHESAAWTPTCPTCRAFNSVAWRAPGGTRTPAPKPLAASANLMPPLPVPAPWPGGRPAPPQPGPPPETHLPLPSGSFAKSSGG
jgi:HemY protein